MHSSWSSSRQPWLAAVSLDVSFPQRPTDAGELAHSLNPDIALRGTSSSLGRLRRCRPANHAAPPALLPEPQGLLKKIKFTLPLADLALAAEEKYSGGRRKKIFQSVYNFARLDAVFHALSDPTRRAMLGYLAERERSIGELATPFRMTLAGASKHVRVLEHAGLVTRMIRGRTHLCRLQAARLAEADAWLKHYERFWSNRLALDPILRKEDRKETAKKEG